MVLFYTQRKVLIDKAGKIQYYDDIKKISN